MAVTDVQTMTVNGRTVKLATNFEIRPGYSPYIGDNGDWYVYDITVQGFVDTGVVAETDKYIIVSNTQPTEENNKIWFKDEAEEEFTVPTYDEFTDLKNELAEYEDIFTADVDESVQNWLDEHPEATTTVEDGSLTKEKFSADLYNQVFSAPINVLTLGVKNDGSEDISTIINNYAGKNPLYFPVGEYLVSATLEPKVSIIGAGYGRGHNKNATLFIQGESTVTSVIHYDAVNNLLESDIRIENIGIKMVYDGDGILFDLHGTSVTFTLDKISITGLLTGSGLSFYNDQESTATRAVYASNLFILGNCCGYESYGINAHSYIGDNQWDTVEIMGVRVGIKLYSGIHNFVNVHIWTGLYGGNTATTSQAQATKAIHMIYHVRANFVNLYTDTAHMAIVLYERCACNIVNWTHWDDGTLDNVDSSGKNLIYADKDNNVVSINNAIIKIPLGLSFFSSNIIDARIYGTIRVINNYYTESTMNLFRVMQYVNPKYLICHKMPTDSKKYLPVAFVHPSFSGKAKIRFVNEGGTTDVVTMDFTTGSSLTINSATVTREKGTTTFHLYYKIVGASIVVFMELAKQSSSWNLPVDVTVEEMTSRGVVLNPNSELFTANGATSLTDTLITADVSGLVAFAY